MIARGIETAAWIVGGAWWARRIRIPTHSEDVKPVADMRRLERAAE